MKNKELQELKPVYIHEARHSTEDEINLVDLAVILARRKIMVLSIIILFIALGITKALITPKQYMVSTTIEIGSQIIEGQVTPFESPQNLLAKLQHSYIPSTLKTYQQSNPGDKNSYIIRSSIPSSSKIIILEMNGTEAEIALMTKLQQSVTQLIIQDHNRIFGAVKQNLITSRDQAKAELAILNANDNIQTKEKLLLSEEKRLLKGEIEIYELQLANLLNTREISPPMKSTHATSTGKKLIIALALFAGILLAIFTTFLAEFIDRVKERSKEEKL